MSEGNDGPDTSSIKPFSSLRSKFESLGQENDTAPRSPIIPRQPSLTLSAPGNDLRPNTSGGEGKTNGFGFKGVRQPQPQDIALAPTSRRPLPDGLRSRPVSMISAPASPPLLTVDSPRFPLKDFAVDLRRVTSGTTTPIQPLTPHQSSDSPNPSHCRAPSRTTTPALEARAAAFLQSAQSSTFNGTTPMIKPAAKDVPPLLPNEPLATPDPVKAPPAVNRAAKPKIPAKPMVLAKKPSNLAAPEVSAELTDKSASPFSTPPSSRNNSPATRTDLAGQTSQRLRNDSSASMKSRARNDSDASWVQRIRGDSDASVIDRARAGSNASFVEPSSLPDNWAPPPTHHVVTATREQQQQQGFGLGRNSTMPTRHRPMPGRQHELNDDAPEERPRLPTRPELQNRSGRVSPTKVASGRTSPLKSYMLPPKRSVERLGTASRAHGDALPRVQSIKTSGKSALNQAFDRASPAIPSTAPMIPAPRRSSDRRRDMPPPPPPPIIAPAAINGHSYDDEEDPAPYGRNSELVAGPSDYPDATQTNRRAPRFKARPWQIPTDYDTRLLAACGEIVCTTGYITKAWNIRTGAGLLNMEHRENTKVTSIAFKPSPNIEDEGKRVWVGTSAGDIHEIDIPSQALVKTKVSVHRREIIRMFRYASEIWTLDDGGELFVWKPDHKGMPSLDSQCNNWRVARGHSFSIACGNQLWLATGKDIRVYLPGAHSDAEFNVLRSPLSHAGVGDVTSGARLNSQPDLVYFGHSDGKVSIYSRKDFACKAVVNVSVYKISCMAGVGDYLWAGYSTGMAYVYDTSTNPWTVKKDWRAHEKQIATIIADPSAMWKMGRLNVITLGTDNLLRIWDGMLADDWLETRLHIRDSEYCTFHEMTAAILTWNAGATRPVHLQHSIEDSNFFRDYIASGEPPDMLVFGFQELVDLEDKKMTAKSLFKSRKKDSAEQEHMSRQYREWRDHLTRCVDDNMPNSQTYTHLHTSSMVGLFTCIFVKSHLRQRIRHVHTAEVKRGMGGHHGNKGALILRMVLDDSSVCFVNCHLAAGQTQTMHRNNDVAEILEATALPSYPLNDGETANHSDIFASGGDGSMIMDHEICILNGDLNYRIDTMGRDAVIKQVQQGNLGKLLERDQLLLSRKKNPGFRLRAFQESPITFAPTYKYNVHTDEYDTSEKRRAPAWCDRILYRGLGKVKMIEYRRWDQIRVSDHRPVSGRLRLRVKTVDVDKREIIWDKCVGEFESVSQRIAHAAQIEYLTNVLGMNQRDAAAALQGA